MMFERITVPPLIFCLCLGAAFLSAPSNFAAAAFFQQESSNMALQNQAAATYNRGVNFYNQDQYQPALLEFKRALELYRRLAHNEQMATCFKMIGEVNRLLQNYDDAIAAFNQALPFFVNRLVHNPLEAAETHRLLAQTYLDAENYSQALSTFEQAGRLYKKITNLEGEARCTYGKGLCYYYSEDYDSALNSFQAAEALFKTLSQAQQQVRCRIQIALCYQALENHDQAIQTILSYINLTQEPLQLANGYYRLGHSYYDLENFPEAISAYLRALNFYQALNNPEYVGYCQHYAGDAFFEQKNWEQAGHYYELAAASLAAAGKIKPQIISLISLGNAHFNSGRYEMAKDAYQISAELAQQNNLPEEAQARERLGETYDLLKLPDLAAVNFEHAARLFSAANQYSQAVAALIRLGDIQLQRSQSSQAIESFRRAAALAAANPELSQERADCQLKIAEALRLSQQPQPALEEYRRAIALLQNLEGGDRDLAKALDGLGHAYFDLQQYPEASVNFIEAARLYLLDDQRLDAARCHYNSGLCYYNVNDLPRAHNQFSRALEFYTQLDDRQGAANCRLRLAYVFLEQNLFREARQQFETAIQLCTAIHDSDGLADGYSGLARIFLDADPPNLSEAENLFTRARNLYTNLNDLEGMTRTLRGLAEIEFNRQHYPSALLKYEEAGNSFVALGNLAEAARCFENVGNCHFNLKNYGAALPAYQKALAYYQQVNDPQNIADGQVQIADSYLALFEIEDQQNHLLLARQNYESAFRFYERVNDHKGMLQCLTGLGDVYFNERQFSEARSKYEEALTRARPYIDAKSEVRVLYKLAQCYIEERNFERVFALLNQIYNVYLQERDLDGQLQTLLEQAELFRKFNQFEKALAGYDRVLQLTQDSKFVRVAKIEKANLLYLEIGEKEEAQKLYREALELAQADRDSDHVAASQMGLANLLFDEGEYGPALAYYENILAIAQAQQDEVGIGKAFINIGNVHKHLGFLEKAENYYREAQAISQRIDVLETLSISLNNLGTVDLSRGLYTAALEKFQQAEKAAQRAFFNRLLISVYANQGVIYETLANYEQARDYYDKAISIVEQIRADLKQEKLIQTFVASTAELYDRMIALLFEKLNDPHAALSYIERSRSKGLLEDYRRKAQSRGDQELLANLDKVAVMIEKIKADQKKLLSELSKPAAQRNENLVKDLSQLIARNTREVNALERMLLETRPDYPGMMSVRAAQVSTIQDLIPRDATVVMYYPDKDKLFIFVASHEQFIARSMDIPRDVLYTKIREYRALIKQHMQRLHGARTAEEFLNILRIRSWNDDWIQPLTQLTTELHQYLIRPFQNELTPGQTVIFIPAGELSYLPLHALAEEQGGDLKFVLENWRVAYLTSTTFTNSVTRNQLRVVPRELCANNVVAFGNSTGKLAGVDREMLSLKQFAPQAQIHLGADATEEQAKQLFRDACFFVISDHCHVNEQQTDKTFLLLAASSQEDGFLYSGEIEDLRNPMLDLVMLPNCESAIGQKNPNFGVHNLVESFSVAGAISIIATLWPISDYITPQLLHEFYKNYFASRQDKAEALQRAQIELIRAPETRHPFFWAGFMLFGYWNRDLVAETTRK